MTRNARIPLGLLLTLWPVLLSAQIAPALRLAPLPADARSVVQESGLPESAWSVAIVPLPPVVLMGPVISGYGLRAEEPMNPASVMKLVTTRAALGVLGAQFRHRTRLATTGTIERGVLRGDVYFQGGGDPKLVVEDLTEIAQRLKSMGIERMEGRLVIDGSRFDEPEIDPGQFDRRPTSTYNVGPHAAMVNFKSVRVSVWPENDRRIRVVTEPKIPERELSVNVKLIDGGCGRSSVSAHSEGRATLKVVGTMGRKCNGVDFYVSVMDHARFAYVALKSAWEDAGGVMTADLASGPTPPEARTLLEWESPRPLIELVADINKMSNNPMTRQLFLNLSAAQGKPATRLASTAIVREYLASRGMVFPELVIDNGSGLSRDERISATSLARLLTDGVLGSDAQSWIETLPMVGIEGTVRNRLRNSVLEGRAWLKTGTLDNVRALAGYIRSAEGRWVVFVAMVNHPEASRAKASMESLLKWAYTYH